MSTYNNRDARNMIRQDARKLIREATSTSFEAKPTKVFGYSFLSSDNVGDMLKALNASTMWTWSRRVNDTHGEYLLGHPEQHDVRIRIFSLPENRYHLDMLCVGEAAADSIWRVLDGKIHKILQKIGASEVKAADYFD